ncbi:MAG: protein kinase [Planctomycetes bacterium]|nr:protein kinase [Planctomycetota bacterium]
MPPPKEETATTLLPKGWRALVMDGDRTARRVIGRALGKRGALVLSAHDCAGASAVLARETPALAVVAVASPEALDLIRSIQSSKDADRFPIVALCSQDRSEDVVAALEAGASDCLTKPFSLEELVGRCLHALRVRQKGLAHDPVVGTASWNVPRALGGYEVLRVIGRGGYGVVLEGWDPAHERRVALKVVPTPSPDQRKRFEGEVACLSALCSPYVARLRDCGEQGRHSWLALEYVPGPTLTEYVAEHGPLEERELIQFLGGAARALVDIHAAQIVHRDLNPQNVILREGDIRQPVLVGFGLSRDPSYEGLTGPHEICGSAGYMAPEYMLGRKVDHRSDLYSLGVTLLFAATGERPFRELTGIALIRRLSDVSPPIPSELDPALGAVLARLVHLKADQRYRNAAALLHALSANQRLGSHLRSLAPPEVFRILQEVGTMLGVDLDPISMPDAWPKAATRAAIDLEGAWNGRILVECSEGVARRLGASFLGLAASELEQEDLEDAVAEIANIVAGQLKKLLPQPTEMSLPLVPGGEAIEGALIAVGGRWRSELIGLAVLPA